MLNWPCEIYGSSGFPNGRYGVSIFHLNLPDGCYGLSPTPKYDFVMISVQRSAFMISCCVWPGIGSRLLYKDSNISDFGTSPAKKEGTKAWSSRVRQLCTASSHHSHTLQTGRAMSFFPNSSGFVMNGGEFQIVNNEGTNKIEKGKHIFVHF